MNGISASSSHAIEPGRAIAVKLCTQLPDLLRIVAALSENSPDNFSLIVPDVVFQEGAALLGPEAWLAQWAEQSKPLAIKTLAQARGDGAARATLAMRDATGGVATWDVVLSWMSGFDVVLSVARDVSERMSQEVQLRRVAYQDGLTGLLNRAALRERLDEQICVATGSGGSVAVLMLDLDNFKLINDTLGHDAGDAVLIETAARLQATVPSESVAGRLGGDEFAVIVASDKPGARATFLAEDLLEALRRPVTYKGRVLDTRASIGIARFPDHGTDAAELLKNADIALYAAKSFGRGGFTTYVPSMGNTLRKRAATIATVREAIAQHRLEAFYQPMVDLRSRAVLGYEALLRLRDSAGTLIPAHAIHQAFDDIDLARQIGDTMFERVAVDVQHWKNAGIPVGRIALNASAAEFRAGDFAPRLLEKLRRAELAPELFEIEVAETVLAGRGTDYVATALADLSEAGVRVALDEFGTGASSLAQLKRLPFHSIKIDRTFVGTLEDDNEDRAIVRAIVGLADGLGLGMTAVGVETSGQVAALRKLGCNVGQGNLLGEPGSGRALYTAARSLAA
jgi:diguanylate cyclase (GGDEF)-like protein